MRSFALAVAALVSLSSVVAETHTVLVGDSGTLTYKPSSVVAKNGDTIQFQFVAKNHTVTQSTFAKPCELMNGGVDSGFMPVDNSTGKVPSWSFTLQNDTTPLWFFCLQNNPADHCSKGMVFAVNPTAEKSFDAFQKTAMGTTGGTTTPGNATTTPGGTTSTSGNGNAGTGNPGATNTAGTGGSTGTPSGNNTAGNNNGAMSMTMSTAGLVSFAGLVTGLLL